MCFLHLLSLYSIANYILFCSLFMIFFPVSIAHYHHLMCCVARVRIGNDRMRPHSKQQQSIYDYCLPLVSCITHYQVLSAFKFDLFHCFMVPPFIYNFPFHSHFGVDGLGTCVRLRCRLRRLLQFCAD